MHTIFLFSVAALLFSSCVTTPEVSSQVVIERDTKILANQSDAKMAQDEYKKLQATRDKE